MQSGLRTNYQISSVRIHHCGGKGRTRRSLITTNQVNHTFPLIISQQSLLELCFATSSKVYTFDISLFSRSLSLSLFSRSRSRFFLKIPNRNKFKSRIAIIAVMERREKTRGWCRWESVGVGESVIMGSATSTTQNMKFLSHYRFKSDG